MVILKDSQETLNLQLYNVKLILGFLGARLGRKKTPAGC